MRVAVTGSTGRLGKEIHKLRPNFVALGHDVTSFWGISGGFDTLIHLAAMTHVPTCERERDLAWKVNVVGTANAVEWCLRTGCKMVYMSSSYAVNPVNWYGRTKRCGEIIASHAAGGLIVRSQFKERPYPYNIAPTDAYARAMYADEVANELVKLVEGETSGIVGIWGKRRSLFDFARESRSDVKPCLRRDLPHTIPADASPEASSQGSSRVGV